MRLAKPHNRQPDIISLVFDGITTAQRVGAISGLRGTSDRHDRPDFKFIDVVGAGGKLLPIV